MKDELRELGFTSLDKYMNYEIELPFGSVQISFIMMALQWM